jgi:adenosylcobyric acid synthase
VEGNVGSAEGLGLLKLETTLQTDKCLRQVSGVFVSDGKPVAGYEIHMGISFGPALERPLLNLAGENDGAISMDNQIAGTYLHGLFDLPDACNALLAWAGYQNQQAPDVNTLREAGIDRVAAAWAEHCDFAKLDIALDAFYTK